MAPHVGQQSARLQQPEKVRQLLRHPLRHLPQILEGLLCLLPAPARETPVAPPRRRLLLGEGVPGLGDAGCGLLGCPQLF